MRFSANYVELRAHVGKLEGLLGDEMDLRELQRTGRIGRIKAEIETHGGKAVGEIFIPSSLDKVETAILAAALETIDRIGPCSAKVTFESIEDVRESKRKRIVERAIEILRRWSEEVSPETEQIINKVIEAARVEEICKYGKEGLPAGPEIDSADEIIVVEGRADVLNMLKYGFKNVIAVEGTSVPRTIVELSKRKTVTAFLDGDRGGDLILKELLQIAEIDYVARAPPGREVEELTFKEIMKALSNKVPVEQIAEHESWKKREEKKVQIIKKATKVPQEITDHSNAVFGSGKARILGEALNMMAEVNVSELADFLRSFNEKVGAVILDGIVTQRLIDISQEKGVKWIVGVRQENIVKKPPELKVLEFSEIMEREG
ncbi:MAG: DNA primase DnaG [Candidatus Jordarchaeales archaeon]